MHVLYSFLYLNQERDRALKEKELKVGEDDALLSSGAVRQGQDLGSGGKGKAPTKQQLLAKAKKANREGGGGSITRENDGTPIIISQEEWKRDQEACFCSTKTT